MHCVKSVQIRSFFWSVFSCIRNKYGDLRHYRRESGVESAISPKLDYMGLLP